MTTVVPKVITSSTQSINATPVSGLNSSSYTYNGNTYTSLASSTTSTYYIYNLFDNDASTFWYTSGKYTNGVYSGSTSTTIQTVGNILGEWAQIQFSFPFSLTNYIIISRPSPYQNQSPKTFYIVGSNDGTTWVQVDTKTIENFDASYNLSVSPPISSYYTYYRIIVQNVYSGNELGFAGWYLTGNIKDPGNIVVNGGIAVSKHMNVFGNITGESTSPISAWTGYADGANFTNITWLQVAWSPTLNLFATASYTGGYVMTSPDGITWTRLSAASTNQWHTTCWSSGLGIFLSLANTGTNRVMTSSNGTIWSAITPTSSVADAGQWIDVCWSQELAIFCAVGDVGKIMTSPNGTTWTNITPVLSTQLRAVVWISELGLFIAAGASGKILTSTNGSSWNTYTYGTQTWSRIAWSQSLSRIVIVGFGGTNNIIISVNGGTNWANATTNVSAPLWGIAWSHTMNMFAAAGEAGVIYTSPDGYTWTLTTNINTTVDWRGLVWAPEIQTFCAMGYLADPNTPTVAILRNSYNPIRLITSNNFGSGNKAIFNDGLNQGSIQQLSTDLTMSSSGNKVAIPLNHMLAFNSTIASYATPITGMNANVYVNPTNSLTYIASASSIELSPNAFSYYAFDGVSSTYWGNESNTSTSGNIGTIGSYISIVSPGNILGSGVSVNQLVINSCTMYGPSALTTPLVATIVNYTEEPRTQTQASFLTAVQDGIYTKMTRYTLSLVSGTIYVYQVDSRYKTPQAQINESSINQAYKNGTVFSEADGSPKYRLIYFDYSIILYKYERTTGEYIGTNTTVVQNVGTVSGEWLQMQLPFSMVNNSYLLRGRDSINQYFMPRQYYIIGSNNGTTWYYVDYKSDPSTSGGPINFELSYNILSNTSSYSYYRIIINKIYPNANICYLSEWKMTGLADAYTIQNTAYSARHKIDPTHIHANLSGYDIIKQTLSLQNSGISTISIGDSNLVAFCLGTIQKNTIIRGIFIYTVSAVASGCHFGLYKARTGELVAYTPTNSSVGANMINYINLSTPYTVDETTVYYLGLNITSPTNGLSINHSYYNYGFSGAVTVITSTLCRMTQYTPANSYTSGVLPSTVQGVSSWTASPYNVFCGIYGGVNLILNGDFSSPAIAADSYFVISGTPNYITNWVSSDGLSFVNNSNAWKYPMPYPSAPQCVSIQGERYLYQNMYLVPGMYSLRFSACGRPTYTNNTVRIDLSGNGVVSTITTFTAPTTDTWYTEFYNKIIVSTAGTYGLYFIGTNPMPPSGTDTATAIDNVEFFKYG